MLLALTARSHFKHMCSNMPFTCTHTTEHNISHYYSLICKNKTKNPLHFQTFVWLQKLILDTDKLEYKGYASKTHNANPPPPTK